VLWDAGQGRKNGCDRSAILAAPVRRMVHLASGEGAAPSRPIMPRRLGARAGHVKVELSCSSVRPAAVGRLNGSY
jgi:hypothetical protein